MIIQNGKAVQTVDELLDDINYDFLGYIKHL